MSKTVSRTLIALSCIACIVGYLTFFLVQHLAGIIINVTVYPMAIPYWMSDNKPSRIIDRIPNGLLILNFMISFYLVEIFVTVNKIVMLWIVLIMPIAMSIIAVVLIIIKKLVKKYRHKDSINNTKQN